MFLFDILPEDLIVELSAHLELDQIGDLIDRLESSTSNKQILKERAINNYALSRLQRIYNIPYSFLMKINGTGNTQMIKSIGYQ